METFHPTRHESETTRKQTKHISSNNRTEQNRRTRTRTEEQEQEQEQEEEQEEGRVSL